MKTRDCILTLVIAGLFAGDALAQHPAPGAISSAPKKLSKEDQTTGQVSSLLRIAHDLRQAGRVDIAKTIEAQAKKLWTTNGKRRAAGWVGTSVGPRGRVSASATGRRKAARPVASRTLPSAGLVVPRATRVLVDAPVTVNVSPPSPPVRARLVKGRYVSSAKVSPPGLSTAPSPVGAPTPPTAPTRLVVPTVPKPIRVVVPKPTIRSRFNTSIGVGSGAGGARRVPRKARTIRAKPSRVGTRLPGIAAVRAKAPKNTHGKESYRRIPQRSAPGSVGVAEQGRSRVNYVQLKTGKDSQGRVTWEGLPSGVKAAVSEHSDRQNLQSRVKKLQAEVRQMRDMLKKLTDDLETKKRRRAMR